MQSLLGSFVRILEPGHRSECGFVVEDHPSDQWPVMVALVPLPRNGDPVIGFGRDEVMIVARAPDGFPEIVAAAKRKLADEYDAAQERGEVGQSGSRSDLVSNGNEVPPSAADLGISRKDIHEARQIRDA